MRNLQKVYNVANTSDTLDAIETFLTLCGYPIFMSKTSFDNGNIVVARDMTNTYYWIFFATDNFVYFTASDDFDNTKHWYNQHGSIYADLKGGDKHLAFILPNVVAELHCNSRDNTIMFSTIETSNVTRFTHSILSGQLTKYFDGWGGGLYVGGTRKALVVEQPDPTVDDDSDADGNSYLCCFESDNNTELFMALRADIDNAPTVERNYILWATNTGYTSKNLVCSITTGRKNLALPTYYVLEGHSLLSRGYNSMTLNAISLCMPIIFYVLRDPHVLNTYSAAGSTDIINYVNMFNMSSGRIIQSDYPVELDKYQCVSIGKRRNASDLFGYPGLAFRQEKESGAT